MICSSQLDEDAGADRKWRETNGNCENGRVALKPNSIINQEGLEFLERIVDVIVKVKFNGDDDDDDEDMMMMITRRRKRLLLLMMMTMMMLMYILPPSGCDRRGQ